MSSAPIGVFDSGLGGLTVVRALLGELPNERLLYVGDTARVPYGPKSPETVRRYAVEIATWLVGEGAKCIVVACNTATAHAVELLQHTMPVPVIGVVEPGARAAVRAAEGGRIGIIGTAGTVASGAYERAIHAIDPAADVSAYACPLFVPLVEEGWTDREVTRLVASTYLAPLVAASAGTLVLGCTHYPLLSDVIAQTVGPQVALIDSAAETARETARVLEHDRLLAAPSDLLDGDDALRGGMVTPSAHRFVASDAPERFRQMASGFLGRALTHVEHVPFG